MADEQPTINAANDGARRTNMEKIIDTIRSASEPGATETQQQEGATALQLMLTALGAKKGETISQPEVASIVQLVRALRMLPVDQVLDFAISKLRTMLPENAALDAIKPLAFPIIPIGGAR